MRDFGMSLVEIFIPIIFLIDGRPLYTIGLFYVLGATSRILTGFTLPSFYGRFGVQNALRVSLFLSIPYIILINYVSSSDAVFVVAALMSGIMHTLYWVSRHIDTIGVVSGKTSAAQLGSIEIASSIMRITAPFIGGVIAEYVSVEALFGVAFGIFIAAALTISREVKEEASYGYKKPDLMRAFTARNARPMVANLGMNYQVQAAVLIWPIVIYASVDNLGTVGGILAFGNIIYMILTYYSTRSKHRIRYMLIGITGRIIAFVLRIGATTVGRIVGTDIIGATSNGFYLSIYTDYYYRQAHKDKDTSANVIGMEIVGDVGKLLLWAAFTWGAINVDSSTMFSVIFILAIPMTALGYLMYPSKRS